MLKSGQSSLESMVPVGTRGIDSPTFFKPKKEPQAFEIKVSTVAEVIHALKQFPKSDLYRFIIDGRLHESEKGWFEYALREPGSLPGVFAAFEFILGYDLANPSISSDLIKQIHLRVGTPVSIPGYRESGIFPGKFRTDITSFTPIVEEKSDGYCNEAGFDAIKDFVQRHLEKGSALFIAKFTQADAMRKLYQGEYKTQKELDDAFKAIKIYTEQASDESIKASYQRLLEGEVWKFRAPAPEFVDSLVESVCQHYNSAIKVAATSEDKLRLIVSTIQEIERIHPFADCNGRTSYILLQRLLIQNGFLPSIMFNPNHLDGHQVESVIQELKQGMMLTQALIDDPDHQVFGYQTPKEPLVCDLIGSIRGVGGVIRDYYTAEQHLSDFIQSLQYEESLGQDLKSSC